MECLLFFFYMVVTANSLLFFFSLFLLSTFWRFLDTFFFLEERAPFHGAFLSLCYAAVLVVTFTKNNNGKGLLPFFFLLRCARRNAPID